MTDFKKRIITYNALNFIKKITLPLRELGISHFNHDITFGEGHISILTDDKDLFSFYLKNEYPLICSDSTGRLLKPGIYLNKVLINEFEDCSRLLPVIMEKFSYHNLVHIVEVEPDCQHLYTFVFHTTETKFLHFIANHLYILKKFLIYYKNQAKEVISTAKNNKHHIILPYSNISPEKNIDTDIENKYPAFFQVKHDQITLIHKNNFQSITLSLQQSRCLQLAIQGYTAKEIAREIELSYRTVQHYIAKILDIVDCRNLKQLFAEYAPQLPME